MGTNYYLKRTEGHVCPTCKRGASEESLHIGKSSGGWCFSLHVIPELGINTLDDWRREWKSGQIEDEYGDILSIEEMEKVITVRGGRDWDSRKWGGPLEYRSEAAFHSSNHIQRGPNGLARHSIGTHCVGHGDGTWDYITGEFS